MPLGEQDEVVQEDLAEEGAGLDARLGHADRVELVALRLEEAADQRKEDFLEDGDPFVVVRGGEVFAEQGPLERRHGLVPDLAARVEALGGEGAEYR